MSSLTPDGTIESAMKASASAIRFRLMHGNTPPPRPARPRPKSPFSAETTRAQKLAEQARLHRLFPKVIMQVDDDGNEVLPPMPKTLPEQIIDQVAAKHHVTVAEIKSHRRDQVVARARFEAMWRMTKETSLSLPAIGRKFDRDHTSVLHAVRQHEKRMREAAGA